MENKKFDVRDCAWEIWETAHEKGVDIGVAQDLVLAQKPEWNAMTEAQRAEAIAPYIAVTASAGEGARYFELSEAFTAGDREGFERIIKGEE